MFESKAMFQPIRKLIVDIIDKKFSVMEFDPTKEKTGVLCSFFENYKSENKGLDLILLKKTVSCIFIDGDGNVRVKFINGAEVTNINSLKEESEVYIGIHSVMAQTESENISANVKWGIGKRMENGTYHSNMNMYGYRRDKLTKEVRIVPEEAEVVRTIYRFFLDGMSTHQIKEYLEKSNIKTYSGGSEWRQSAIINILKNEKYCGDVLYQKTYILDCISKKKITNNGDKTRYLSVKR